MTQESNPYLELDSAEGNPYLDLPEAKKGILSQGFEAAKAMVKGFGVEKPDVPAVPSPVLPPRFNRILPQPIEPVKLPPDQSTEGPLEGRLPRGGIWRPDGTPKGSGYFGALPRPDGQTSTELSIDIEFDGYERLVPLIVPTLTRDELDHLLSGFEPTQEIMRKVNEHAKTRISQGLSPFAQLGEQMEPPPKSVPILEQGRVISGLGKSDPVSTVYSPEELNLKRKELEVNRGKLGGSKAILEQLDSEAKAQKAEIDAVLAEIKQTQELAKGGQFRSVLQGQFDDQLKRYKALIEPYNQKVDEIKRLASGLRKEAENLSGSIDQFNVALRRMPAPGMTGVLQDIGKEEKWETLIPKAIMGGLGGAVTGVLDAIETAGRFIADDIAQEAEAKDKEWGSGRGGATGDYAGAGLFPKYPTPSPFEISQTVEEYWAPLVGKNKAKQYVSNILHSTTLSSVYMLSGPFALPLFGISSGGQKARQLIQDGVDIKKAVMVALPVGLSEALTEKIPLNILRSATLPFIKKLMGGYVSEVPGEIINTIVENSADYVADVNKGRQKTSDQWVQDIVDTVITTVGQTTLMTGMSHPVMKYHQKKFMERMEGAEKEWREGQKLAPVKAEVGLKGHERLPEEELTLAGPVTEQNPYLDIKKVEEPLKPEIPSVEAKEPVKPVVELPPEPPVAPEAEKKVEAIPEVVPEPEVAKEVVGKAVEVNELNKLDELLPKDTGKGVMLEDGTYESPPMPFAQAKEFSKKATVAGYFYDGMETDEKGLRKVRFRAERRAEVEEIEEVKPEEVASTKEVLTPYEYGKKAFGVGLKAVPMLDTEFIETLKGRKVGVSDEELKEWQRGWNEANLKEPEGLEETRRRKKEELGKKIIQEGIKKEMEEGAGVKEEFPILKQPIVGDKVTVTKPFGGIKVGEEVEIAEVDKETGDVRLIKKLSPTEITDYGFTKGENVERVKVESGIPRTQKPKPAVANMLSKGSRVMTTSEGDLTDGHWLIKKGFVPEALNKRVITVAGEPTAVEYKTADIWPKTEVVPVTDTMWWEQEYGSAGAQGRVTFANKEREIHQTFDSGYVSFLESKIPNFSLKINIDSESPAIIMSGNQEVGVIMPVRGNDALENVIGKEFGFKEKLVEKVAKKEKKEGLETRKKKVEEKVGKAKEPEQPRSAKGFAYQLKVQGEGDKWIGNQVVFPIRDMAADAGSDKLSQWTMAKEFQVVEVDVVPNYEWVKGELKRIEAEPAYGESNKGVTQDRYEEIKKKLKEKAGRLSMGVDPELITLGVEAAAYHIEAGAHKFVDFAHKMIADFGDWVRPYLKEWYNQARDFSEIELLGMDSARDVAKISLDRVLGPAKVEEGGLGETGQVGVGKVPEGSLGGRPVGVDVGKPAPDGQGIISEGPAGPLAGDLQKDKAGLETAAGDGSEGSGHPTGSIDGIRGGDLTPLNEPTSGATSGSIPTEGQGLVRPRTELGEADRNNRIEPDDVLIPSGKISRLKANVIAIKLAKKLESENRNPTPQEKKILQQFTGWGALGAEAFKSDEWVKYDTDKNGSLVNNWYARGHEKEYKDWFDRIGKALHPALGGILSEQEWADARSSITTAFYTTKGIIEGLWKLASHLGIKRGTIIEPSAGIGHFLGLIPQNILENSNIIAVEKDSVSGLILKKLYPQANVQVMGYQEVRGIQNNMADLVISNFPFNVSIFDPVNKDYANWPSHNYFFARSIDALRPGGIVIGITSHYTLDSIDPKVRAYLSKKADLVGAIRLPGTAFEKSAGTQVTTDVIIFRKKDVTQFHDAQGFLNTKQIEVGGKKFWVNEYYVDHPEKVLGEHSMAGTMYAPESYEVIPKAGQDLEKDLIKALMSLPADIAGGDKIAPVMIMEMADKGMKEGFVFVKDGNLVRNEGGLLKPWVGGEKKKVAVAYIRVRDEAKNLITLERSHDATDEQIEAVRSTLNSAYDKFVAKHGFISDRGNRWLYEDAEYPLVTSLERLSWVESEEQVSGKKRKIRERIYIKGPMLLKRVNFPFQEPVRADSHDDAVKISMTYRNLVDPAYISSLLGETDVDKVKKDLIDKGLAFMDPDTGMMEVPESYLSGNVRDKLSKAREAAKGNSIYEPNVVALEKVQPAPLTIDQIHFRLGSEWLPVELVHDFITDVMGVQVKVQQQSLPDRFKWSVDLEDRWSRLSATATNIWGVEGANALDLIEDSLNLERTIVKVDQEYEDADGRIKTKKVEDPQLTANARKKQSEIQTEFRRWTKAHETWGPRVAHQYNTEKNNSVLKTFRIPDIKHYPGASHVVELYPHQKKAVSRALMESTYLAHAVGTGKTYIAATWAMESRRLGIARKPIIIVQNSTVQQYARVFRELYPNANVLIPTKKDTSSKNRKRFISLLTTGDYDAVVLAHSVFDMIGVTPEREASYLREELAIFEGQIGDARARGADKRTITRLENDKQKKKDKIEKILRTGREENSLYFEDFNIDGLFIDEAHRYKRSEFFTQMTRVKGIDSGSAAWSTRLLLKSRAVLEKTNGKNIVLASGTPISNTMAELWTLMRYIRPDLLDSYGVKIFDSFATTFGDTVSDTEETPTGDYRVVERFAKYINGPELLMMAKQAMDIVLPEDVDVKRPTIKTGKPIDLALERPPELAEFIRWIKGMRDEWDGSGGRHKMESRWVPLWLFNVAKQAAIDLRLVSTKMPDLPGSKANRSVEEIYQRWQDQDGVHGTQLLFCNTFQNKNKETKKVEFNLFEDIKKKLIAKGIPKDEIAIIHDYIKEDAREDLLDSVNDGVIRILMGTTERLGIGVNVQEHLTTAHLLDVAPRPMDFEQRMGRIWRPGNPNDDIEILFYGVKNTLDSTMYQRVLIKQKFINQLLRGDIKDRSFEDPFDESQNTYEEMMAAFGNPLVRKKFGLEAAIRDLMSLKDAHQNEVGRAREKISINRNHIEIKRKEGEIFNIIAEKILKAFPGGKVKAEDMDIRFTYGDLFPSEYRTGLSGPVQVKEAIKKKIEQGKAKAVEALGKNADVADGKMNKKIAGLKVEEATMTGIEGQAITVKGSREGEVLEALGRSADRARWSPELKMEINGIPVRVEVALPFYEKIVGRIQGEKVGSYRGEVLIVTVDYKGPEFSYNISLLNQEELKGISWERHELFTHTVNTAQGVFNSLSSRIASILEQSNLVQKEIDKLDRDNKTLQNLLDEPFSGEQDIVDKRAQLERVEEELRSSENIDLAKKDDEEARKEWEALRQKYADLEDKMYQVKMEEAGELAKEEGLGEEFTGVKAEVKAGEPTVRGTGAASQAREVEEETGEVEPIDRHGHDRGPLSQEEIKERANVDRLVPGLSLMIKGANKIEDIRQGALSLLFPGAKSPRHLAVAERLGKHLGIMGRAMEGAGHNLRKMSRKFDKMGIYKKGLSLMDNPAIKFMSDMSTPEGRLRMPLNLRGMANMIDKLWENGLELLEKAGVPLESVREAYFPGVWTRESIKAFNQAIGEAFSAQVAEGPLNEWSTEAKTWVRKRTEELIAEGSGNDNDVGLGYLSRTPFKGKESFRKKKTFDDIMTAVEFGLKPISVNPIDLVMLKLSEIHRSAMSNGFIKEEKELGEIRFLRSGREVPRGWQLVKDRFGTVFGPPYILLKEYVDKMTFDALNKISDNLGIMVERKPSAGRGKLGWASSSGETVVQIGTELSVMMHEIAHQLDNKYDLWNKIMREAIVIGKRGKPVKKESQHLRGMIRAELRAIADLKWEGQEWATEGYKAKVREREEQLAEMFELWIANSDRMLSVAPHVTEAFEKLIKNIPEMEPLKDWQSGISYAEIQTKLPIGGFPIVGHWIARQETADILNNYLSSTIYNTPWIGRIYKGVMATGNALNQFQLGIGSTFHGGFTTADVQIWAISMAEQDIIGFLRGKRTLAQLMRTLKNIPIATVNTSIQGHKYLREWRSPTLDIPTDVAVQDLPDGSEERIAIITKAFELSGTGFELERGLRTRQSDQVLRDWQKGIAGKGKAILRSPIAFSEVTAVPVMELLVPRQKAGVLGELMWRVIEQNPTKTLEELIPQFRQKSNKIDMTMGQIRWNKIFMHNWAKNILQALIRAPGWKGGTIAIMAGAPVDTARFIREWIKEGKAPDEIPDSVTYATGLVVFTAVTNAILTALFTGEPPEGWEDLIAFRDGGIDENGKPTRCVLPTYMKELYAWHKNPESAILNSAHPFLSLVRDEFRGVDYYGVRFREADAGLIIKILQSGEYAIKQFEPFWIRGLKKVAKRSGGFKETPISKMILPNLGVMPVSGTYFTTPAEEKALQLMISHFPKERTEFQFEKSDMKKSLIIGLKLKLPDAGKNIAEAYKQGKLTRWDVKTIVNRSKQSAFDRDIERLSVPELFKVWDLGNLDEKQTMQPIIIKRYWNSKASLEEKKSWKEKYGEVKQWSRKKAVGE